jgi:hypothetical protein
MHSSLFLRACVAVALIGTAAADGGQRSGDSFPLIWICTGLSAALVIAAAAVVVRTKPSGKLELSEAGLKRSGLDKADSAGDALLQDSPPGSERSAGADEADPHAGADDIEVVIPAHVAAARSSSRLEERERSGSAMAVAGAAPAAPVAAPTRRKVNVPGADAFAFE